MDEMIEVYDENGKRIQIPRSEYVRQLMTVARANWDNLEFLRQLTVQFMQGGFAEQALELAEQSCKLSNEHVNDLYWRAAALAETGRLEDAEKAFAELQDDAAYAADQARAAVGQAQVKARMGKGEEAGKLLEWAIETDPQNPGPMLALLAFWSQQGQGEAAVAKIHQLAHSQPDNPAPFRALAQGAAAAGDKDGLKHCAEEIIKRTPADQLPEAYGELSWMLGQAQMPDEIIAMIEPQKNTINHPWALMNLAQAYVDTGRKDEARQLLQALAEQLPPPLRFEAEAKLKELQ